MFTESLVKKDFTSLKKRFHHSSGQSLLSRHAGPRPEGLYPEVNRTALQELTGIDSTALGRIFRGERGCPNRKLGPLARALGVPMERLEQTLRLTREKWLDSRGK